MSELQISTRHSTHRSDERIINSPNLPENNVSLAAISETAGESIIKLNSLGIRAFPVRASDKLSISVNSHADIRLLHIESNVIFCHPEESNIYSDIVGFRFLPISENMSNLYPNDVRLNCAVIGNKIICNKKTVSSAVLNYAIEQGFTIIDTKQGYSKCSVCIVDENSIITDDPSIYKSAQFFFNDVLFIEKGSIGLKGADYGFIGGCTGKLGKNIMAFNGRIESHSEHNKIIDFFDKHNINVVELNNNRAEDIGGILPLKEYINNP